MIAVIQRVDNAAVVADGQPAGACGKGLLILLGVAEGDGRADADALASKISKLRVFCDENDKMNLSVMDVDGQVLVVSNFTLLANYRHGNRPDYLGAAKPAEANELYEYFSDKMSELLGKETARGVFGADMKIAMNANGPITIVMDSKVLLK